MRKMHRDGGVSSEIFCLTKILYYDMIKTTKTHSVKPHRSPFETRARALESPRLLRRLNQIKRTFAVDILQRSLPREAYGNHHGDSNVCQRRYQSSSILCFFARLRSLFSFSAYFMSDSHIRLSFDIIRFSHLPRK